MPMDSAGKTIKRGDRVCFRGRDYTIRGFRPGGRFGTCLVDFEEASHLEEAADEISVDLVLPTEAVADPKRVKEVGGA